MEHELRIAVVDDMEQDRIQIMEETDAILSRAKLPTALTAMQMPKLFWTRSREAGSITFFCWMC